MNAVGCSVRFFVSSFPVFVPRRSVFYVIGYRKTRAALSRFRNIHKPLQFQPPLSFPEPISDVDRRLRLENLFTNYEKSRMRASLLLDDISIFTLAFRHCRTELFSFMIPTRYEVDPPDLEKKIMRLISFFYKRKLGSRSKTRFHFFAHLVISPRPAIYGSEVVSNTKGRYGNNDLFLYVICNLRPSVRRLRFLWSTCFDPKGQLYRDHLTLFPTVRDRSAMHAILQTKIEEYYAAQDKFKVACGRRNFTLFKESLAIPCYASKTLSCLLLSIIIFRSFPMEPYSPRLTPFLPNVSQLALPQFTNPYLFLALEGSLFYPSMPPEINFYLADSFSLDPLVITLFPSLLYQKFFSYSAKRSFRARHGITRFADVYLYVNRLRKEAEKYVMDTAPWLTFFLNFKDLPFNYKETADRHRRLDTLSALRYQKRFCEQVEGELSPVLSSLDNIHYDPTISEFTKDFKKNIEDAGSEFLKFFTPNPQAPKEKIDDDFWYFHGGRKNRKFSFPSYIKKGVVSKPKSPFGLKKRLTAEDLTWSAWFFDKLEDSPRASMDDFPFSEDTVSGPSMRGLLPYRHQRVLFKLFGGSFSKYTTKPTKVGRGRGRLGRTGPA